MSTAAKTTDALGATISTRSIVTLSVKCSNKEKSKTMKQLIGYYTYVSIDGSYVELYGNVTDRADALVVVYLLGNVLLVSKCNSDEEFVLFASSKFTLMVGDNDMIYKLHKGYGNK